MLNRAEIRGPKGEKPDMYQQKDMINDDGYVQNVGEELVLDREQAKETLLKRVPNVKLYDRVSLIIKINYCVCSAVLYCAVLFGIVLQRVTAVLCCRSVTLPPESGTKARAMVWA